MKYPHKAPTRFPVERDGANLGTFDLKTIQALISSQRVCYTDKAYDGSAWVSVRDLLTRNVSGSHGRKEVVEMILGAIFVIAVLCGLAFAAIYGFEKLRANNRPVSSSPSYQAGFNDGYLVGKTDASRGDERNGEKAMRLARINAEGYSGDQEAYRQGYHFGYNEGWNQRKAAMRAAK